VVQADRQSRKLSKAHLGFHCLKELYGVEDWPHAAITACACRLRGEEQSRTNLKGRPVTCFDFTYTSSRTLVSIRLQRLGSGSCGQSQLANARQIGTVERYGVVERGAQKCDAASVYRIRQGDGGDAEACCYCEIVKRPARENNLYLGIVRHRLFGSSRANPLRHLHQVGERFRLHLVEHVAAMQLDGDLAEV
jgi:hypothetical protein